MNPSTSPRDSGSARPPDDLRPDPLDSSAMPSLRNWDDQAPAAHVTPTIVDCGWGRLLMGQTFASPDELVAALAAESPQARDVAMYVRDPHVVVARAPQQLFLDPSHTFRVPLQRAPMAEKARSGWYVRPARRDDEAEINRILSMRRMVPVYPGFMSQGATHPYLTILVAQEADSGVVLGVVTGVDHTLACGDPEGGSSLWSLAVDPQSVRVGIGMALVADLARRFRERGRHYIDLSVMHDNVEAIQLYDKVGFKRVPVYCVKNRNPINERLYVGPDSDSGLNVYAQIIVNEARRRGINAEVIDAPFGYFKLSFGGRSVVCRESLSELTTAVAMSRCDDKRVTRKLLDAGGVRTPDQITVRDGDEALQAFIEQHGSVVVKPARGEQGHGISVDVRGLDAVHQAIEVARRFCDDVIIEELVRGDDLRIVVIDFKVVAAATRRPAHVIGDGVSDLRTLIVKQSRRRAAATQGESRIPLDAETERCIRAAGHGYDSVLPDGAMLTVRKTANLHTGGTIHDVTDALHPVLREQAERAARLLDIPVVGLDFMVPRVDGEEFAVIEANERPGLANHEPQPTVQRFVDLLFPQTRGVTTS
jgi:GNAT-family acetyltransferase (TIGR03103 family)